MEQELTKAIPWTFLDHLNEGVIILETDGVVRYSNPAARLLLGLNDTTASLQEIYQVVAPYDTGHQLLNPPAKTRLQVGNGRVVDIHAKSVPGYEGHRLVQLLITSAPPNGQGTAVDHLTALTRINKETDFDKKLQLIVNGLQKTGWNRIVLSLRDKDFQPTKMILAGFTPQEKQFLKDNMMPPKTWQELFASQDFERYRRGDCYFIPGESEWARKTLGEVLPDLTATSKHENAWHPKDLLFVPLYDQQQQIIGLLGLDQPINGRRPGPRALQTLELYAQFGASVIENTQLVQETLDRSREFQTLFEANRAISGILDKNTVVTLMGKHMRRAINGDGYTIYQWLGTPGKLLTLQDYAHPKKFDGEQKETLPVGTKLNLPQDSPIYKAIVSQEPQIINSEDTQLRPFPIWLAADEPFTAIILPIIMSDDAFGVISLISRDTHHTFTGHDLQLLTALSTQANTVLESALLFEDTYERERFYNAMGRVSLAINYTLDQSALLSLICKESLRIFGVDGAYLWQREGNQFVGNSASGHEELQFPETIVLHTDKNAFVNLIYREGRALFINHISSNGQIDLRLPRKESIQAVLGVPLKREGEIIGVMVLVDTHNPDRFKDQDITQATTFSVQVAIALQNARMFEELRHFNEELDLRVAERTQALNEESNRVKILLRISSELAASLDQDRVLNQALNLVNEVVNATQAVIMLINQETDDLVFRAYLGMERPSTVIKESPSGIKRDQGLAGWMIQHRSAVIVHDTADDPRWIDLPNSREYRSVLGVPLITNEEVIGVMMLFHTETAAFTMQQLDLVEAAAIQVANAINNANLYDLIRDQAERLGSMLRAEQIEAAKNQAILESIADGVLVADDTSHIILANLPASSILDIPREQLLGKTINELLGLYGHAGDMWINTIRDWSENADRVRQWTYLADQLTIEEKVVSVHLSPVLAGSQYFGTVSIFRDITKEVEVDNLKSEFVSTVSHELRTPMTSIKGYADLILMGAAGDLNESQIRYMQVIKNNADRLHMLVNDLLDISRIETNKTILDLRPLDVSQIVNQVVEGHLHGRIQNQHKEIYIQTDMAPALSLVHADQAKLTQILTNLLDNAFNFTPAGGQIIITSKQKGDFVSVSIADTGIGIPEKNLDKIFERFFRSETPEVQNVPGTGLGLSIVNSLVELLGGKLSVKSEVGEGSTFTFTLPVVIQDSDPA
ncbi:MAG: GAF domain-containing protein [Anaerolineae bacterium]